MPCCSAINCCNRSENGYKLFRFPVGDRRAKWVLNVRRGNNWTPTETLRLCEKHFENSQFESHRFDGWKKLKPNAIPTLFDVPNPPPMIDPPPRKSLYKNPEKDVSANSKTMELTRSEQEKLANAEYKNMPRKEPEFNPVVELEDIPRISDSEKDELSQLRLENKKLLKQLQTHESLAIENQKLRDQINLMKKVTQSFLNDDQIKMLEQGRILHWPYDSIVKALKFRFALSVHGYEYLRTTGYPLPAYSTIMRRIQDFRIDFGIFEDVLQLLRFKVEAMDPTDKFCVLSYDEMKISEQMDYDKNLGKFVGHVTLGNNPNDIGEKVYAVVIRGIKNHWKQIIACHVTGKVAIDPQLLQDFILNCIKSLESCGLYVITLSSDLDSRNRSLWSSLKIHASRHEICNSFSFNNHEIFAMPDPCHLLKNLKAAMFRQILYLPETYVELEALSSNVVNGAYVKILWKHEITHELENRLLHHLRQEDINPTNYDKMNVGATIRFFSPKTSSALKTAVENNILPREALTTAHFILLIYEWFSIMTSKVRKTSITSRNCDKKYIFLHTIIDLFKNIVFGNGWKPLNYGFVIATLTFCDVAEFLMKNKYDFVLGHRFTQDVTENIFSQVRHKQGSMPTALQALQAVRLISISQFISEIKRTSYTSESDEFLLNFCQEKTNKKKMLSACNNESLETSVINATSSLVDEFQVQTFSLEDCSQIMTSYNANSIFYIAGSTTNAVIKHICSKCIEFLSSKNLPDMDFINKAKYHNNGANRDGLKEPCLETLSLNFNCEYFFTAYKKYILKNGNSSLIQCLVENINIAFPECCNIKEKIVKHFFTVRSFCVKNFSENCRKHKIVFGTASAKRKKTQVISCHI